MFAACQNHLKDTLKASGVKTQIITSEKKLKACQDSHFGAVICDEEVIIRDGSKRKFRNELGKPKKRKKIFERSLVFDLLIGEYSVETAERIFDEFLQKVGSGIYIDGNFTYIDMDGAEWVDGEDSFLKAKITVHTKVVFRGGVYQDSDMIDMSTKQIGVQVTPVSILRKE